MMKLMIDTNIVLDYLFDREPFSFHSGKVLELCFDRDAKGILTASAITDIFYIVKKNAGRQKARESLMTLFTGLDIADVGRIDLLRAVEFGDTYFEDALLAVCAKRIKADFIVTRNIIDFSASSVAPIKPEELLSQSFPYRLADTVR